MEPEFQKRLQKRLGAAAFDSPSIRHWNSTGSPVLDLSIRDWRPGGWPGGKWIDIYGPSGSAKTGLCLRAAKACQEANGIVFFVNPPEQGLDGEYLTKNGVEWAETPSHNFVPLNPFSLESMCGSLEEIATEYCDKDQPVIVIIDPLSSLGKHAYSMDESSTSDSAPSAAGAKYLHEWFRRGFLYYLAGSKITVLATRHQTASPRVEFGQVDHTTHGSAPDFYSWIRVRMKQTQMEDPLDSNKKGNGAWQTASIRKNKSGSPQREVSMPWYYKTGWDSGMEVILALLDFGALEKTPQGRITWEDKGMLPRELRDLYHSSHVVRNELLAILANSGGVPILKATKERKK